MSYSTVYDVRVRYSVDNRAGRTGTQGLTNDVRNLGNEAKRTSGVFGRLGLAVVGAFGARAAGSALIGFNSTVEDTKNQIAGMLALSKKTDFSTQIGVADRLYARLQKRAASLPGTTAEYVQMLGMLTQPLSNAGATMKDMEDITVNAVVGAKALGVQWDAAARDIDQALRGQYHSTDVFTGKILGSVGYSGEEGRSKFNNKSASERADILKSALTQKQLTQMAEAQGASFSGMLSTLQDTVQQFLGKVGAPLFKVITNELKNWNVWIDKNSAKLDEFAQTLGHGLVKGFQFVKDAVSFLIDHADTLIMIGKVWGAVKLAGMASGGVKEIVGKGAGALSWLKGASARGGEGKMSAGGEGGGTFFSGGYQYTPKAKMGLGDVANNAGLLMGSGMVGYQLGKMMGLDDLGTSIGSALANITGRADGTTEAMDKLSKETDHLAESTRKAAEAFPDAAGSLKMAAGVSMDYKTKADLVEGFVKAQQAVQNGGGMEQLGWYAKHKADMEAAGINESDFGKGGAQGYIDSMRAKATEIDTRNTLAGGGTAVAMQIGIDKLTDYQKKTLETAQAQEEITTYMVRMLHDGKLINPESIMEILRHNTQDPEGKHKNVADKPKVNVTINRIEVQSDDPDRMAFGLIESFRDAAKNPSSALASLREG